MAGAAAVRRAVGLCGADVGSATTVHRATELEVVRVEEVMLARGLLPCLISRAPPSDAASRTFATPSSTTTSDFAHLRHPRSFMSASSVGTPRASAATSTATRSSSTIPLPRCHRQLRYTLFYLVFGASAHPSPSQSTCTETFGSAAAAGVPERARPRDPCPPPTGRPSLPPPCLPRLQGLGLRRLPALLPMPPP